jgi:plastocyanin
LVAKAGDAGLNKLTDPKIFSLLLDAEKRIVDLNKLMEGAASPETVATALKNVKLILATVEELIRAAANPPALQVEETASLQIVVPDNATDKPDASVAIPESATVVISATGFDPPTLKIKSGTKVTWFNKDIRPHWPASDPHPIHTILSGFDSLNGLSQGETYSFVFDKAGVWKYHDHLNAGLIGVVEVTE